MSKQSTAQGRAKKPDKSAPGGTPDEQAPAARTPDAPNMEVLLATMLAKNDEKFEALRSEQSAPARVTAGPSSQPDKQPVSRHRAAKRRRSSPSLDRVVNSSDSEYTYSDSPAKEIEMRTHRKAKRHGSTSGNTASDTGWEHLKEEGKAPSTIRTCCRPLQKGTKLVATPTPQRIIWFQRLLRVWCVHVFALTSANLFVPHH